MLFGLSYVHPTYKQLATAPDEIHCLHTRSAMHIEDEARQFGGKEEARGVLYSCQSVQGKESMVKHLYV